MQKEGDEFTATLVLPVTGSNGAVLPAGTTGTLEVLHPPAPTFIGARLEAIERGGERYAAGSSTARTQREFVAGPGERGVGVGACIPAGGRITVTLRAPVRLGSS